MAELDQAGLAAAVDALRRVSDAGRPLAGEEFWAARARAAIEAYLHQATVPPRCTPSLHAPPVLEDEIVKRREDTDPWP